MSNYGWIPSSTVQQRSYPPASTTTQSTSSIGPAAVITIALASFILLIIGVLHIRCIIRRRSDEAVARNTPPKITRLESTRIVALPTFAYDSTHGASSTQCCSVCLSVVKEGEMVRVLPSCNHAFHINCIDTWLRTRSTCPVCRADVKNVGKSERDPTASAAPPV